MKTQQKVTMTAIRRKSPFLFGAILALNIIALLLGIDYFLGSILVTAYFLGTARAFRITFEQEALTKWKAGGCTLVAMLVWIFIMSIVSGGGYSPSWLLALCMTAFYRTLSFKADDEETVTA